MGFDMGIEISVFTGLSFISKQNTHLDDYKKYDPSLSYVCGSFLFKAGDKNIYYSGDIGSSVDLFLFKDERIDIFIAEAAHIDLESILQAAEKLNPDKIYLTHLEEDDIPYIQGFIDTARNYKIFMAREGLQISV